MCHQMVGGHLEERTLSSGPLLSTTRVPIPEPAAHYHQPKCVHFTALTDFQRL